MRFVFFVLCVQFALGVLASLSFLMGCAAGRGEYSPAAAVLLSDGKAAPISDPDTGFLGTGRTVGEHLLGLLRVEGCVQKRRICLAGTVAGAGPELCVGFKLPGDECYGAWPSNDDTVYLYDVPPIEPPNEL